MVRLTPTGRIVVRASWSGRRRSSRTVPPLVPAATQPAMGHPPHPPEDIAHSGS